MHPWTNDLGWVMSDLGNVFVGKMDSVANDTDLFDEWLQSRGIPNLFLLPKDRKKDKSANKIEFGASNEDDQGPCPARIEAMVRFIHRKMEGTKFDVENYVLRGNMIQVRPCVPETAVYPKRPCTLPSPCARATKLD